MRNRALDHVERLRRQFGKGLRIGARRYRASGYFPSNIGFDPTYESHLMPALRRALEHPGPFVDVGVNLGQTLLKVIEIDPDRAYLGIEPQLGACYSVARFLSDNGLSHMRVMALCLADEDRVVAFHARNDFDPMASMLAEGRGPRIQVQARNGDRLLAELGITPAILKIDVEGAEPMVLQGLSATLDRRPVLFFEQLPNFVGFDRRMLPKPERDARDATAEGIFRFLTAKGYRIAQVRPDGSTTPIDGFALNDPDGYVGADYIAE